jgi:hypothetical protein
MSMVVDLIQRQTNTLLTRILRKEALFEITIFKSTQDNGYLNNSFILPILHRISLNFSSL